MIKGIALRGPMRVGKDSTASALKQLDPRFTRLSFADQLKELAGELTGDNFFNEDTKIKHRGFLIGLGQAMKEYDNEYWLKPILFRVRQALANGAMPVITDVRFKFEADALKQEGFIVVNLLADEVALMERGWTPEYAAHSTEAEMTNYDAYDLVVDTSTNQPRDTAQQIINYLQEHEESD